MNGAGGSSRIPIPLFASSDRKRQLCCLSDQEIDVGAFFNVEKYPSDRDAYRFYLRNGLKVFGQIEDYPPGNTRYFLSKDWSL